MVDNTRAKTKLDSAMTTLEEKSKAYVKNIERLVQHKAYELVNCLTNNNLFVDNELRTKLTQLRDTTNHLVADLNTEKASVPAGDPTMGTYNDLTATAWARHDNIEDRKNEFQNLTDLANNFDLDYTLGDLTCKLSDTTAQNIDLNPIRVTWAPIPNYNLCDENWRALKDWMEAWEHYYEMNIWWRTVRVFWISFVWNRLQFTNLRTNPTGVNLSSPIKLSVNAWYTSTVPTINTVKVSCNKTFNLNLKEASIDVTDRRDEANLYESAGWLNVITNHLNQVFSEKEAKLVRDAIAVAVTRTNSPIFNSLSDEQKEDFYQRMLAPWIAIDWVPVLTWTDWREWLRAVLESYVQFNDFREWFISDDRDWNKDSTNTKSRTTYAQYIHDHFRDEVSHYFEDRLNTCLKDARAERFLKTQVSNYLWEIDRNKRDDPALRNTVENTLNSDNAKMAKKWWKRLFANKDSNFMRFFSGAHKEIKDQEVNISTTTPTTPIDKWPIKYDMALDVQGNNKLEVEIKINWEDSISLQSWDWDPSTLAKRILREPSIKNYKARVHMVYTMYKGLLELAKEKNMKLEYFDDASSCMRELTLASNGNIVLNEVNYWTTPPYARTSTTLFDQQWFKDTNKFNDNTVWTAIDPLRHKSLQKWVEELSVHFAHAMNRLHDNYRAWVKRNIWKMMWLESTTALPTSIWLSPIKKLLNIKNNTNFDFTTSVWDTQIALKWNTFTINNPRLEKPLVTRDLWKALYKRVNKVRVFDWQERDIVEAVYSNLVNKMRENSKIQRTNFGVIDDVTGHMYILDDTGKFWRINRDALNWTNIIHRKWWWLKWTDAGVINSNVLRWSWSSLWYAYHKLTKDEEKEMLKNPLIMQWFVKAMNRRMWAYESLRAWRERR